MRVPFNRLGIAPVPTGAPRGHQQYEQSHPRIPKRVRAYRVRAYMDDPQVSFELRRRERLEAALDALNPHTRARLVKVVGEERPTALAQLLGSRFDHLPDGVTLSPNRLEIEFQGREEFLERLGALIFALENDTERILRFVEQRSANAGD